MIVLLSLTCLSARAASLDLVQVGGMYGTPGATNPSALWWNPAGLARGGKIQFLVEGAPTFAKVMAQRSNPDYGALDPQWESAGYPTEYDYSGTDALKFNGVVPFIGVSSNLMVPHLGVGIGLAVPTARGGTSDQDWGANRYQLRAGNIQTIDFMGGAAYSILGKVGLGVAAHYLDSSYSANTDTSAYPDLYHQLNAQFTDALGIPFDVADTSGFGQDGLMEQRDYTGTLIFGGEKDGKMGALKDHALTVGAGVYITPIGDKVGVSLGWVKGVRLDHEGDLTMKFQCAPEYSFIGVNLKEAVAAQGLCNTTIQGKGAIGYNLPSRINMGVVLSPIEKIRIEAMGSYVMWSAFTDYDITTNISPDAVTEATDYTDPLGNTTTAEQNRQATAELLTQNRKWARDNQDTFWVGLDAKARVSKFTVGGRLMYDHHAIPDSAVSANNIDNDEVIVGLLGEVNPIDKIGIGLSFAHHFLAEREIKDSAFGMTTDAENAKEDRYYYPSANGTYSGSINRIGILVRGHWGGAGW